MQTKTLLERYYFEKYLLEIAITTLEKQVASLLIFVYTCIKVVILTFTELGLFPFFCGVLIDIFLVDLFGSSVGERLETFNSSWILFILLHWTIGFVFMFNFASLIRCASYNQF